MNGARTVKQWIETLRGRDWLLLPAARQDEIVEASFQYWRARGFPHYRLKPAEFVSHYARLVAFDVSGVFTGAEIKGSPLGLRLANSFHPQMWKVAMPGVRSPVERFHDDETLRKVLRKALQVFHERPSLNESNLRRMLQTYSRTARVSNFSATAAKAIYARYSGAGDRVVDFSSGYGGRLLGSLTLNREYVGIDPCRAQVRGSRRMLDALTSAGLAVGCGIVNEACAEDFLPGLPASSCSLVFSSPPYFDNERYSREVTQSYLKFPRYEQWLRGFLRPAIEESHRILEAGGFFVLNVANLKLFKIADDALSIAAKHFTCREICQLRLSQRPYLRAAGGAPYRREPIFIFQKNRLIRPRRLTDKPCSKLARAPAQ